MNNSSQLNQAERLIAAGQFEEAKHVLKAVLAQDRRHAEAWYLIAQCIDDPKAKAEALRRTFLLWTVAAIALQFSYYGANSWLPSYLAKDLGVNAQSTGWYVACTYTMMVVGKVITGWLGDFVGRRLPAPTQGYLANGGRCMRRRFPR